MISALDKFSLEMLSYWQIIDWKLKLPKIFYKNSFVIEKISFKTLVFDTFSIANRSYCKFSVENWS